MYAFAIMTRECPWFTCWGSVEWMYGGGDRDVVLQSVTVCLLGWFKWGFRGEALSSRCKTFLVPRTLLITHVHPKSRLSRRHEICTFLTWNYFGYVVLFMSGVTISCHQNACSCRVLCIHDLWHESVPFDMKSHFPTWINFRRHEWLFSGAFLVHLFLTFF